VHVCVQLGLSKDEVRRFRQHVNKEGATPTIVKQRKASACTDPGGKKAAAAAGGNTSGRGQAQNLGIVLGTTI